MNTTIRFFSILSIIATALMLATVQGCAVSTDGQSPAPEPPACSSEPAGPNLRGFEGNYCYATTDTCTYARPIPVEQLEAREISCPTADVIVADPTTEVRCDSI